MEKKTIAKKVKVNDDAKMKALVAKVVTGLEKKFVAVHKDMQRLKARLTKFEEKHGKAKVTATKKAAPKKSVAKKKSAKSAHKSELSVK
jgi:hypothetical protein